MAVLLFRLSNVPDDEAQDIRDLLEQHEIAFYETDAGFWRVGIDAIWLPTEEQWETAKALIKTYQTDRNAQQKESYARLVEEGQAPTFWQNTKAHPIRFIAAFIAIIFVLVVSFSPVVSLLISR